MNTANPIDMLFGGMRKLGPGSDADTRHVIGLLPERPRGVVVDAGCGTGRQTLVLAKELDARIHAVDTYEPFLAELRRSAAEQGVAGRIVTHRMDMKDIPGTFPHIDLLWSEGAAYNIGFPEALRRWASYIPDGGHAVVSELSWTGRAIPSAARDFFAVEYPAMRSVAQNLRAARGAGYAVAATHVLPRETWVDGYYDVLGPRARGLLAHPDDAVREYAAAMMREIGAFEASEDSYAYVFFILRREPSGGGVE